MSAPSSTTLRARARDRLPGWAVDAFRAARRLVRRAAGPVQRRLRRRRFHDALAVIRQTAPEPPTAEMLRRLSWAWSNAAAGDVSYLLETVRHARSASGPVLECGSGLTTLLLALYAKQPVVSLESDEAWYERLSTELGALPDPHLVTLRHAPLRPYAHDVWWYDVSFDLPEAFALVVCDGPPRQGRVSGRVGLLPVVGDRLPPGTTILVDAEMRAIEGSTLEVWRSDFGVEAVPATGSTLVLRRTG